jgi:phospholipid/cholesterol/gamma-HCH transport system permease protein
MISWGLNVTSTQPSSRREPRRYFRHIAGHFRLAWEVLCRLPALVRWPVRQVMLKQLYFTGTESISTIAVVGFVVGLIVITQINNLVGRNELLTIKIMIWTIVRELGPLLTAIVIIGRSSSAFASELSSMQVNGEIRSLRSMNISPISYLVLPRVLAMTLASITLTFYFQVVAISTGWVVTTLRMDIALSSQIFNFFEIISFREIAASLIKSAVFGVLVALVSCYHGLRRKSAMTEVPQAVSQAVIRSLLMVFVGDGIMTVLMF